MSNFAPGRPERTALPIRPEGEKRYGESDNRSEAVSIDPAAIAAKFAKKQDDSPSGKTGRGEIKSAFLDQFTSESGEA